jgi:hypothetical protein
MREPDAVTIAYLHAEEVAHSWHASLTRMLAFDRACHGRLEQGGFVAVHAGTGGIPEARNEAVAMFLADERASPWLLWLDTDMGFEPDLLEALLEVADPVARPVVGALCWAFKPSGPDGLGGLLRRPVATLYGWHEDETRAGFRPLEGWPAGAVVPVAATGSAAVVIHRSVLERIAERHGPVWYDRIKHPKASVPFGEDLSFCVRAHAVGAPVFVHTGVPTSHLKALHLTDTEARRWDSGTPVCHNGGTPPAPGRGASPRESLAAGPHAEACGPPSPVPPAVPVEPPGSGPT